MTDSQFKLALVRYLYAELGYEVTEETEPFEEIGTMLKGNAQTNSQGTPQTRWHAAGNLALTGEGSSLTDADYARLDANINGYLATLNENREQTLELRYYQYLAVLFTELVLERYENDTLVDSLNAFIEETFWQFDEDVLRMNDFSKLAYWMATGSGKTHIMHINMLQVKEYFPDGAYDNLVLIAPTEQVADQHRAGLRENGISCATMGESNRATRRILVTDINKLKKGESGDKTVDVNEFGGNNIIFVDEGHKGLGSLSGGSSGWVEKRDSLIGKSDDHPDAGGFAFEYSATFASSLQDAAGYQEYSRAILFDYPYGRFHSDGYGKDFNILNISPDSEYHEIISDEQDRWLLANLLSYYEKARIFDDSDTAPEHNIEKPLSVFVGNSVNAVTRGSSDVQTIVEFLADVVENENGWVTAMIDAILSKEDEFADGGLFDDRFEYVRHQLGGDAEAIYRDMTRCLFGSEAASKLSVTRLKNLDDEEVGLGTDATDRYFGVVTVGDTKQFYELIESGDSQISCVENEIHSSSLFGQIDEAESPINFLIGSKKFAEGWDSTRPSTLGLLNIGRSEGPLIVQMFGRGVRVNGKYADGKRSDGFDYETNRLETLDVFGIRAEYIETFKQHLKNERTDVEKETETVEVDIQYPTVSSELKVPVFESTTDADSTIPVVQLRDTIGLDDMGSLLGEEEQDSNYRIDPSSVRIQTSGSKLTEDGAQDFESDVSLHEITDFEVNVDGFEPVAMTESQKLNLLDWEYIWRSAVEYKRSNGFDELVISRQGIKSYFEDGEYTLRLPDSALRLDSFDALRRIENICIQLLCKYIDSVYSQMKRSTEYSTVELQPIDATWIQEMTGDNYQVSVNDPEDNQDLIQRLKSINAIEVGGEGQSNLTVFKETLFKYIEQAYAPVLLDTPAFRSRGEENSYKDAIASVKPEGIDNRGERRFIEAVETHITEGYLSSEGYETIVMRNQSQAGVSIPKLRGNSYPDFVVWVTDGDGTQHIILADPHGMRLGEQEPEIEAIRKVNDWDTASQDVQVHACLFARSLSQDTLEEARQSVANATSLNIGEFRKNNVYFIDDTTGNGGKTPDQVENMLRDFLG
jgi:hypothetical protein